MNKEWSLEVLYQGFEDSNYLQDKQALEVIIKELSTFGDTLKQQEKNEKMLEKAIDYLERYQVLSTRLMYYVTLRISINTSDSTIVNESNAIEKLVSASSKPLAMIYKFLAGYEDYTKYYDTMPLLKEYSFYLSELKKDASYLLSDDVEDVIAKLNISAGSAWRNLQSYLTSTLEVDYHNETITLSEVRNLAHSEDGKVRKEAYEAELKAYEKIKDAVCYSLNKIKTQVNTICALRGHESPLMMTLHPSKMKKETLEAMLEAIKASLPSFHKYLKHKAKILGHTGSLPWYDLFAPIGESHKKFSVEESKEYLVARFRGFSEDLAKMVEEAYEEAWIDFYPKKGKVGGAFCENLPFVKQSRILTNFTGTQSDVITLAHELGHAYHGLNIQEHRPLNVEYSMPVAETASTFNEAIIMESAILEAGGKEKVALIESQLQDVTQIICDIYSRYLFETNVFEKSKSGFLFPEELNQLMTQAQKEAYGDGLDHSTLHPYMWVVKGHYYSEHLSFYNFPYAFGGLLARGLYEKFKSEGASFVVKYKAFLTATTVMSVEDAAMQAGIDITEQSFWKTSLKSVEELIDEFVKLA